MNPDDNEALALARYSVIAPLVSREYNKKAYDDETRRIVAQSHLFPDGVLKRVSRRNLRRWVEWYREGRTLPDGREIARGFDALRPVSRMDSGDPRVLSAALVERAVRLREEEPGRTTAALVKLLQAEALARGEEAPEIREATLGHHLRKRRATRRHLRVDARTYPRFEHKHRNDLWQADMSAGLWLPDPTGGGKARQCFLHAMIDDHTRYVPHAQFYYRQNLACLLDGFRKAIHAGGLCSTLYVDNGPAYHHQQLDRMAARLGIQVVFATPYHPQGKGKIERFFGHVKQSFYPDARRAGLETLEQLNELFWGWLDQYHDRVHSEIESTPRDRWNEEAGLARWPEPTALLEAFLWEEIRVVDRSGCVTLEDNAYPVPEHLVGQKVSLRFDPFDLARVRLYHNGVYVDTLSPYELSSNTFRKALPRRPDRPAPLQSSRVWRDSLSREYRKKLDATLDTHPTASNDCLNRPEFLALLREQLAGRLFSTAEANAATDFFLRYAPLQRPLVVRATRTAVEEKGTSRHLRFYLDAIRAAQGGG